MPSQPDISIIQNEGEKKGGWGGVCGSIFLNKIKSSSGQKIFSKYHQELEVNSLCFLIPNITEGMLLVQTFPSKQKIRPPLYLMNSFAILTLNISKWEALPRNNSHEPIFSQY